MLISRIRGAITHNAFGIGLIFIQSALACAVTSLALAFVLDRTNRVAVETGIEEKNLEIIEVTDTGDAETRVSRRKSDISRLSQLAGIDSVSLISHVPFGEGQTSFGICANQRLFEAAVAARSIEIPGCAMPAAYSTSPNGVNTLGVELMAGRDFQTSDFDTNAPKVAIITHSFGKELYGNEPILGQVMQSGPDSTLTIIGVAADVIRPHPARGKEDRQVVITPAWSSDKSALYTARIKDGYDPRQVMPEATKLLATVNSDVIVNDGLSKPYSDLRRRYFARDYSLIEILSYVISCLLLVTSIGCFSLTWLWVAKCRKSIGIRRALGATYRDIMRMVLLENIAIVVSGSVIGIVLVLASLPWLRDLNIPNHYIVASAVIGFASTLLFGQIAALVPALQAAKVAPAVATRT